MQGAGTLRVKPEAEQQVWHECTRLMANTIIYYNTVLLPHVAEQKVAADEKDAFAMLKGVSPVARRHVHLPGTFAFSATASPIDLAALAARPAVRLARILLPPCAARYGRIPHASQPVRPVHGDASRGRCPCRPPA